MSIIFFISLIRWIIINYYIQINNESIAINLNTHCENNNAINPDGFLGFSNNAFGQVLTEEKNQSTQELYDFHISKKKANNTAAWIALGAGVAMIVGGLGINMSGGIVDNDSTNNNKGLWLSYLGGAVIVVSIPLFISAGKHKKKAKIQLQNGAIGFNTINYTGVSISFSF